MESFDEIRKRSKILKPIKNFGTILVNRAGHLDNASKTEPTRQKQEIWQP